MNSDLERLLDLLLFCQKYEISELETHVLHLVLGLTGADTIQSHLTNSLSVFRVVEISDTLSEPRIATSARAIIVSDLWSGQMNHINVDGEKKEGSTRARRSSDDPADAVDVLHFGERMRDAEVIGAAYYQILVSHHERWALEGRLTELDRQRLRRGAQSCARVWQRIFDDWGVGIGIASGYHSHEAMFGLWKGIAEGRFAHYDVIGKLEAARAYGRERWDEKGDVFKAQERLERIKADLYGLFLPPRPIPAGDGSTPGAGSTVTVEMDAMSP